MQHSDAAVPAAHVQVRLQIVAVAADGAAKPTSDVWDTAPSAPTSFSVADSMNVIGSVVDFEHHIFAGSSHVGSACAHLTLFCSANAYMTPFCGTR
jgi:hypothetical protein